MSTNNDKVVVSFYDYTGVALRPWAKRGYTCFAYDLQHDNTAIERFDGGGSIHYLHADLHNTLSLWHIYKAHRHDDLVFAMAFPVCTDLAVSGAAHFASKAKADPDFQTKAANHAAKCSHVFASWGVPYFIENPVSRLATLWRSPDYRFHPFEYGNYIPAAEADHPLYPNHIAPMDAYSKRTCLWTGGGFKMPEVRPVDCESFGNSRQHSSLGGKSMRTKNIRSATPRGFAEAIAVSNAA